MSITNSHHQTEEASSQAPINFECKADAIHVPTGTAKTSRDQSFEMLNQQSIDNRMEGLRAPATDLYGRILECKGGVHDVIDFINEFA